jgi:multicomponent Na+:H+ antiporter subunit D
MGTVKEGILVGLGSAAGAVALAWLDLFRHRLPAIQHLDGRIIVQAVAALKAMHNGRVGDYVVWLTLGVALLGGASVFQFR